MAPPVVGLFRHFYKLDRLLVQTVRPFRKPLTHRGSPHGQGQGWSGGGLGGEETRDMRLWREST